MSSPVCFVLTSLALTGGIERDAMKCMRALGERGRELHVVAGFVRPGVREKLRDLPIVWHPIRAVVRPPSVSQLMIYLQARRVVLGLRTACPDLVVISFEPNPLADYWVGASPWELWNNAKRRGNFSRSFKPGLTLWQRWCERVLCRSARHILCYSPLAVAWFEGHDVPGTRISQVVIPCDLGRFRPKRPSVAARKDILIIGTNPRLKGIDIALEAWKRLHIRYPGLRLRVVCKGWKVPRLVKRLALPRVEISPFISSPESYFTEARLVLMPSMYESWGNVPLEALACGVPVVVSKQTPSSMVVTEPWLGGVIDRDGRDDAGKLTAAIIVQLQREESRDLAQKRHDYVAGFQARHETTVSWLLRHIT